MTKWEIRHSTLRDLFTLFGVLFYIQVITFFLNLGHTTRLDAIEKDLEGNAINQICGLLTLLVPLFFFIQRKIFLSKRFYRDNAFFLIFLAFLAVSIGWAYDPMLSFKRYVALLSVVFFAGFISYNYSIERITFMLGCAIGVAALIGLVFAVIMPDVAFISGGIRDGAFKGILTEKNAGARINACAILMLLPMLVRRNRWAILWSLCCLVAILLAKSATGIVLIVAGGASYWYFLTAIRLRINRSRAAFFGITLLYLMFCLFMYGNYSLLLSLLDRDPSLTDRTLIWGILEPMIDDKFLTGYGFGAFWTSPAADAFITRWSYIGNAHSGYMETLLNGGVTQLVALIAMLADVLVKQYRAVISGQSAQFRASAMVITGLFIVTNYVAYVIPNYRSAEFLVFCTFALSFRHQLAARTVAAAQRQPSEVVAR